MISLRLLDPRRVLPAVRIVVLPVWIEVPGGSPVPRTRPAALPLCRRPTDLRSRARTCWLALVAASVPGHAPAALASTLKVPASFSSIQAAIDAAKPNDTIEVKAGIYRTRLLIPAEKAGLTICGDKKTVIDAYPKDGIHPGPGIEILADGVTLEQLTIQHARSATPTANVGTGVVVTGADVVLDRVHVSDSEKHGFEVLGADGLLKDCSTSGNGFAGQTEAGYFIRGARTRLSGCSSSGDHDGISTWGYDIELRDCEVHAARGIGILLAAFGEESLTRDCRVRGSAEYSYVAGGSGRIVSKENTFEAGHLTAVVLGARGKFADNRIRNFAGFDPGIEVGSVDDLVVADNRIEDVRGAAILCTANGTIMDNRIERCGNKGMAAIKVLSNNNLIEGNSIDDSVGDGISLSGWWNVVEGNEVARSGRDGIRIVTGSANEVRDNKVARSGGEGIENRGTATIAVGNTSKSNRLDVASTTSFATFSQNEFLTGGPTAMPEFD